MSVTYEKTAEGELKINLSGLFKDRSRRNNLAFFFQKLVYLVCSRYLRIRISDEMQKAKHNAGRSHWLTETLLYRSLGIFNSFLGDDHLFDKNNLKPLEKRLEFLSGSIVEVKFCITLIGRYLYIVSLGDGNFILSFGEENSGLTFIDEKVQDVLKEVLENEM